MAVEPTNGNSEFDAGEIRALEAEATILLARMQFMRQHGVSFKGARDLYEVLGFDREITTEQYRDRYERGGIAGTIVDVMVDATWRGGMWLEEDEDPEVDTPFEASWAELEERLNLTTYMVRADRLSRLSDYAVMLIGTSLNGDLNTELPQGKPENLIFLQPYSGAGGPTRDGRQQQTTSMDARAKVASYDKDARSPRYGQPATYNLRLDDGQWANDVHYSRIVHVAEGCLDDDVFGRSVLKRVWNDLDNLDKIVGGGAEAFFLRANQGLVASVDKDMQLSDSGGALEKLKDDLEKYQHNITRWIRTRGVDVKTLGSDVANFGPSADSVLKLISGSTRIPTRILTGSEMGELASSQDRENFKDQVNGRQEQHAGPNIVRKLADRLIAYGYLPEPAEGPRKYTVKFAHIQTMTEGEKTTGAKDWAAVNASYGSVVFTDSEIREKWADKAPLSDEQKKEIEEEAQKKIEQAQAMLPPAAGADDEEKKPGFPRAAEAAEDVELIRVLAVAIEAGNQEVVHQIIGLQAGPHTYGSTQVQLPADVAAKLFAIPIADADLYEPEGGRETDAHVTVKYGLLDADANALSALIANRGKVSFTLGKTGMFAAPDYDVVFVEVNSPDLADLNATITQGVSCKESDHGIYHPHATVAYVKPGTGSKYTGLDALDGVVVSADAIVMSDADGARTEVSLLDQPLKALGGPGSGWFAENGHVPSAGANKAAIAQINKVMAPGASILGHTKKFDAGLATEAEAHYASVRDHLVASGFQLEAPEHRSSGYRKAKLIHETHGKMEVERSTFAPIPSQQQQGMRPQTKVVVRRG